MRRRGGRRQHILTARLARAAHVLETSAIDTMEIKPGSARQGDVGHAAFANQALLLAKQLRRGGGGEGPRRRPVGGPWRRRRPRSLAGSGAERISGGPRPEPVPGIRTWAVRRVELARVARDARVAVGNAVAAALRPIVARADADMGHARVLGWRRWRRRLRRRQVGGGELCGELWARRARVALTLGRSHLLACGGGLPGGERESRQGTGHGEGGATLG